MTCIISSDIKTQIQAVLQPTETAAGMPNKAYTQQSLFDYERDHLFAKTWCAIGYEHELKTSSYAKPINFMGYPLFMVKNRQADISVFHNVCSHRGMKLVAEEKSIRGMITCPYHSWSYNLKGELKATPHVGGVDINKIDGFICPEKNLKQVRSHCWLGIVFVNLSETAPSFDEFIDPLIQRWSRFITSEQLNQITYSNTGAHFELMVNSNWKFPVENYCEAYHLPWLHPGLNSYSPLNKHYNIMIGDSMSGQGSLCYTLAETSGIRLPQFKQWPGDMINHAEYVSLYPNVLLGLQADHFFSIILDPLNPEQTHEKGLIQYIGAESNHVKYDDAKTAVLDSWKIVFAEDIEAVEGMQQGRHSPGYTGGVFSPVLDVPTHHFHRWVANQYLTS